MSKQPPACEMLLPLQKREGFMGNRALHYHHTWNSAGLGLEQTSSPAFHTAGALQVPTITAWVTAHRAGLSLRNLLI